MMAAFVLLVLVIYIVDTTIGRFASVLLVTWLFWFWLTVRTVRMFRRPVHRGHG